MEKPNLNRKQNFFSEWLEKLQQESWQLELLISGLALFGIWESKSVLYKVEYFMEVNSIEEIQMISGMFMSLLWASWYIFLLNLLVHIIIRGFWIGAIGLRYVSGDIDYDDLNYSDRFTNHFKRKIGSFDDYIERLEKISSVLFSFTFLLFFMLLSFVMYSVVWIIIYSLIVHFFPPVKGEVPYVLILIGGAYWLAGFLVMVDFFTIGAFKKIKERSISGFYFYVFRFYSIVSLSFIYRPLLLNFIDNKYTRRLFYLSIPYALILMGLTSLSIHKFIYFPSFSQSDKYHSEMTEETINWNYYDDLRQEYHRTFDPDNEELSKTKIEDISLSNYEVQDMYLKFFLEYEDRDNSFLSDSLNNEKIYAFREKGLKYLFDWKRVKDKNFDKISDLELAEIRLATKVILNQEIPTGADQAIVEKYKSYAKEDIKTMRDEVIEKYDIIKANFQKDKLQKIKQKFLSRYEFYLDDDTVTSELDCKFYIHPNMRERGLLCYLNIDTLDYGGHLLNMHKKHSKWTLKRNVPFRKVK